MGEDEEGSRAAVRAIRREFDETNASSSRH
jgi:hypothetical protein